MAYFWLALTLVTLRLTINVGLKAVDFNTKVSVDRAQPVSV
jgi:hypothetical protein